MLRSEGRDTLKLELLIGRTERVTDGENTRIKNADDISGISLVNDLTALSHQLLRLGQTDLLTALNMVDFHSGLELTGTDAHECDTVTVRLIHIRLDLKYEGGEILSERVDHACSGLSRERRSRHI